MSHNEFCYQQQRDEFFYIEYDNEKLCNSNFTYCHVIFFFFFFF
jgi:hypothetical protein